MLKENRLYTVDIMFLALYRTVLKKGGWVALFESENKNVPYYGGLKLSGLKLKKVKIKKKC